MHTILAWHLGADVSAMNTLRVILVEDSEDDAVLVMRELVARRL
jgi:hypothetical protein